jgi:hypothetical protein
MTHKLATYSFFPLIFLFIVLNSIGLSAQNDTCQLINEKLETYQKNHFQERLFVHTDKTFYIVGENLWMKIYLTDALLHKPSNLSKIVYLEVLNNKNKSLLRSKIRMEGGFGHGSFKLPSNLLTGNYTLRAYTQWMRNEGTASFFEQSLTITNTLNDEAKSPNFTIKKNIDFQFFPEGGHLMEGIENKIAFKVVDAFEKGLNCEGFLLNEKNDTIVKFTSFKMGMGNFVFKPNAKEKYSAIVYVGDSMLKPALPKISTYGFSMFLLDTSKDDLSVQVSKVGNSEDENVYLLLHGAQFSGKSQQQKLKSGLVNFHISKKDLKEGVNRITIFNTALQPVCERSYFNFPKQKLSINISSDNEVYDKRSEVQIGVQTTNILHDPINANLSLSVFLIDTVQPLNEYQDIESYMLLSNELKGWVQAPASYFDSRVIANSDKYSAIDNLMLTQGWTQFDWPEVFAANKSIMYLPELEGPIVHAKIMNKKSGLPVKQVLTYFSVPGKPFYFSTAKSDSSGNLLFNLKTDLKATEAILQTNPIIDTVYNISLIDPFETSISTKHKAPFLLPTNVKSDLLNRSISSQSQTIFDKSTINEVPQMDTTAFFGNPSTTYYLDAYTRFTSMEELTKEYVKEIKLKEKGKDFSIVLWNSRFQLFNEGAPLLLMDGVPIFNINNLLAFDPLKISKIDIITETNLTGNLFSNGIVSYSTYNGDLAGYPIDANALLMQYEGTQSSRKFYSPSYSNRQLQNSKTPDLRNVLHWDPVLLANNLTDNKIHFYSSDLSGKYAIFVQGISSNGLMGSCIKYINVR